MKKCFLVAGMLTSISSFSPNTFANYEDSSNKIPKIVVSSERFEKSADEIINQITVVTREDIDKLNPSTTGDILRLLPGVNVNRSGSRGTLTGVFLYGLGAGKEVAVLIDGIISAQDGTGAFDWSTIDPDIIERIEIIRGAKATSLGNGSVATINIITRKSSHTGIKYTAGSYGTKKTSITAGKNTGNVGFNISYADESVTGYSATNESSPDFNDDIDGFKSRNVSLNAYKKFGENSKLSISFLDTDSKADYDNSAASPVYTSSRKQIYSLKFEQKVNDLWKFYINTAQSRHNSKNIDNFSRERKIEGEQNSFVNNLNFDIGTLILGQDYIKNDTVFYTFQSGPSLLSSTANFASWQGKIADFSYELGLRKVSHNRFGNLDTNNLGIAYQINKNLKVKLTSGKFTSTPTSYQLNGDGGNLVNANPDLKEQTNKTTDFSVVYEAKTFNVGISTYQTKIENEISYTGSFGTPVNTYVNATEDTDFTGSNIYYTQKFANNLDVSATFTILNYEENHKAGNQDKIAAPRRPNKLNININKKIDENWFITTSITSVGKTDSSLYSENDELKAYNLIHLNTKYNLNKNISFGLKIENLTDENYEEAFGYNTPGRSFYLTAEYSVK